MAWSQETRERLIRWHEFLWLTSMDIAGDFAGEELFAVHGEALVAHCIQSANVDYDYGFQLLHAVHAVESFLSKMSDRGCNFHIVWLDRYKHLCVPQGAPRSSSYKYLLTRDVVIQHLARSKGSYRSFRFQDIDDDEFHLYLLQAPVHFFLCGDSRVVNVDVDSDTLDRLSVGYRLMCKGYRLAFIDNVEFSSSKVGSSMCCYISIVFANATPIRSMRMSSRPGETSCPSRHPHRIVTPAQTALLDYRTSLK